MKGCDCLTNDNLRQLVRLAREGGENAFAEIYQELKVPVYTVALRITGDVHTAEDTMQEVFLSLFRNLPDDNVTNVRAWIFRVTHNEALNLVRARKVKDKYSADCDDDWESIPDPEQSDFTTRLDINSALALLPPDQREIITLYAVGGLKLREIASVTGLSAASVGRRYRKAVEKLKKLLR